MDTIDAFVLGAVLNLLFNATAALISRRVAINITRWGWLYFCLHATYLVLSMHSIKQIMLGFRDRFGSYVFMSYVVVGVLGALISLAYWKGINRIYAKAFSEKSNQTTDEAESRPSENSQPRILPNVFIRLIIDTVGDGSVQYHLQVENGPYLIKNVRVLSNTSEFSSIEMEPPARSLPPHKDFSITGLPAVFYPTKYAHLDVSVGYTVDINGIEKNFISKCRFSVRPSDIKPQTINPEFRTEDEGTLDPEKQFTEAFLEYLSLPKASFGFAVDEVKDGQQNPVRFGGTGKRFLFNPIERIVTFQMETGTGRSVNLSQPIPRNKSGKHLILLEWDETGALLGIDGIEIKDMPSQDKKRESSK